MRKLHGGSRGPALEAAIDSEIAGMEGGKDDGKGSASWGEVSGGGAMVDLFKA